MNPLVAAQNFEYKMSNILGKQIYFVASPRYVKLTHVQTNLSRVVLAMSLCCLVPSLLTATGLSWADLWSSISTVTTRSPTVSGLRVSMG